MRKALLFTLLTAAAPLCACASIHEAVHGPSMAPMDYPSALVPTGQNVLPLAASAREPLPQPASANSLWRTGARAFFHDQRAGRVGDIVTVLININDAAKTSNATNASRTGANTAGITNFLGLESTLGRILPKAFSPASAVNTSSALASSGTGGVTRQEQIQLTVAAVVTQVLPNGNMVIQGRQEVETNDDIRELTVAGIIRPEDISSTNTVLHTQIAEARIVYGGRGDISTVQKTPAGTALMQKFLPF
jgi:flagellar L-ring protein precursor FlgH